MRVINQPNCVGVRVPKRGTEVPEGLVKGMKAVEIDQIELAVLRSEFGKEAITRHFVKYSLSVGVVTDVEPEHGVDGYLVRHVYPCKGGASGNPDLKIL